jgi:hypothetical protein
MLALRTLSKFAMVATLHRLQVEAFDTEVISDIVTSSNDESRALDVKNEQFWQPVLESAEAAKMSSAYLHLSVYDEVDAALARLPQENDHVKQLLAGALVRLRRADEAVFAQAVGASQAAEEQLLAGPEVASGYSFFSGGKIGSFFSEAIGRFAGFGRYKQRLGQHVHQRQAEVLPVLRGAAGASGVLKDCREGIKMSFDALKYDIYNEGVPKTPEFADDVAHKLVGALGETRHHFLGGVTAAASSIARDSSDKEADPSLVVTQSLVQDLDRVAQPDGSSMLF